jgi:hypothetical protein
LPDVLEFINKHDQSARAKHPEHGAYALLVHLALIRRDGQIRALRPGLSKDVTEKALWLLRAYLSIKVDVNALPIIGRVLALYLGIEHMKEERRLAASPFTHHIGTSALGDQLKDGL